MGIRDKLTRLFQEFPGIGPRQARRFVYALLEKNKNFLKELSSAILELEKNTLKCSKCFSVFETAGPNLLKNNKQCYVCRDITRDAGFLLVVERDVDFENIEKSKLYDGKYFILGGVMSPLRPETQKLVRFRELFEMIKNERNINEVIIATSLTREGEATAVYIEKILNPFVEKRKLKITRLGRGLSTGTEIEYSDSETIKNALKNRK
jgi:recombination protein RecR